MIAVFFLSRRCLVNPDPIYGVYMNKNGEMYTTSETNKGGQVQCHDRNGNCLWSFYLRPYKNGKITYQPFQVCSYLTVYHSTRCSEQIG